MLQTPMDVLHQFPVRKSRKQKQAFRDAVCAYAKSLDYPVTVEKGTGRCMNVVMGDPESAEYLVTAHYDTPARNPISNMIAPCSRLQKFLRKSRRNLLMFACALMPIILELVLVSQICGMIGLSFMALPYLRPILFLLLIIPNMKLINFLRLHGSANPNNANDNTSGIVTLLEIMGTMPEKQRHKVCFVLFDLEELGLVGSKSYRRTHKEASEHQLVLNMDCVGDGDLLTIIPTKMLLKDRRRLTSLYRICGYFGEKSLLVCEDMKACYPSDQNSFPYGVVFVAMSKHKRFGLYLD